MYTDDELVYYAKEIFEKYGYDLSYKDYERLKVRGQPSGRILLNRFECGWESVKKIISSSSTDADKREETIGIDPFLRKINDRLKSQLEKERNRNQVFIENCLSEIKKLKIRPRQFRRKSEQNKTLNFMH